MNAGRGKDLASGIGMLVVFGLLVALVLALYNQAFTPFTVVTLQTDRSGLLMDPGSRIKLDGVDLGRVAATQSVDGGAELTLNLIPELAADLPANVGAVIVPSTAFGPKFVDLTPPAGAPEGVLTDGSTIAAQRVSVEVNTVFDNLMATLDAVRPADLNVTLTAIATAVDNRGDQLGDTAVQLRDYLAKLNPKLDVLQRDLAAGADVADLYAEVAPDLLRTLDDVTTTSRTVTDRQDDLDLLLTDITTLGVEGTTFLQRNGDGIVTLLDVLRPTTDLLEEYSPGLTCFIQGLDVARSGLEPALGGFEGGNRLFSSLLPAAERYRFPADLPEVAADSGPACHGLPRLGADQLPAPYVQVDGTGTSLTPEQRNYLQPGDEPLIVQLFGPVVPPLEGDR